MNKGPDWNASSYEAHGRFVSDLGAKILEWLAVSHGEVILDAGCGDGVLTKKIAELGGVVEGIEQAPSMALAAEALGLSVRQMDLLQLDDVARYDAIFSNAVLHWISDWDELFKRFAGALKPSGRLVVECGGFGNIAAIRTAVCGVAAQHGVSTLAAAENYQMIDQARRHLETAGFALERIELQARPTFLKSGMAGWLSVFREPFLLQFEEGALREKILAELVDLLEPQLMSFDGSWYADYVRLRFIARLA